MSMRALMLGIAAGAGALYVVRMGDAQAAYAEGFSGPSLLDDLENNVNAALDTLTGAPSVDALGALWGEPNVAAFGATIRTAEGTADPEGYTRLFGGGQFVGFADHPRVAITATLRNGKTITSTAAGAYQILARTWDGNRAGLPDFSPASQDVAALRLVRRRGALDDVRAGRFVQAIGKCAKEWASLPGSPYGQPTISMDDAASIYAGAGGEFA